MSNKKYGIIIKNIVALGARGNGTQLAKYLSAVHQGLSEQQLSELFVLMQVCNVSERINLGGDQ